MLVIVEDAKVVTAAKFTAAKITAGDEPLCRHLGPESRNF